MERLAVFLASADYYAANRLRLAELLVRALFEPPFSFRWPIGNEQDRPSQTGSALAFLRLLDESRAQFIIYGVSPVAVIDANRCLPVGFACGVVLTKSLIAEMRMNDPLLGRSDWFVQPGDYYCAACAIDAPYRSRLVAGKKVYRSLCELRLLLASLLGCPRAWVRTHRGQEKVIEMYRRFGFTPAGYYDVEQGAVVTPRVIMAKDLEPCSPTEVKEMTLLV